MKRRTYAVVTLLALLASWTHAASELKINVQANREHMYIGESVLVTVTISGISNPPRPDASRIRNCKIQFRGSHDSSEISLVNGRFSRKSHRKYSYELTPNAAGPFTAGPFSVAYAGKTRTVRGPLLQVAGIDRQDWVEITIRASRESVIVDEPFDVTASISIRALEGSFADLHPMDTQQPPGLTIPYLRDFDGLKGPDLNAAMQKMVISRRDQAGFSVNNIALRSSFFPSRFDFDGFSGRRLATFSLPRRTVTRGGKKDHVYDIKLSYVAKKEGSYTFGPIEYKGPTAVSVAPGGRLVTRPIFTIGPAATVRVVPPPSEGRPASFIGAIGSELDVTAELDAQTCNVGDPLKLTLEVSGDINLDNVTPPILNEQEALTRDFRIYDDTLQSETREGRKFYSYTIRPTRAGTYEFPPVAISYYDVERQAYATVYSEPLPIRAKQTASVGGSDVISTATNRVTEISFASRQDALAPPPITMSTDGSVPMPMTRPALHLWLATSGPCVFGIVLCIKGLAMVTRSRRAGKRRREAGRLATARLKRAARENDAHEAIRLVSAAMREYVADTFEVTAAGLTPADSARLLATVENDLRDAFVRH